MKKKEPWLFLKAIIELEQKIKLNKDNNIKPFVEYNNKKLISLPKSLGEKWQSNELIKFLSDIEFFFKEFLKRAATSSEFISILLKKCDFRLKKDKFVTDEITDKSNNRLNLGRFKTI